MRVLSTLFVVLAFPFAAFAEPEFRILNLNDSELTCPTISEAYYMVTKKIENANVLASEIDKKGKEIVDRWVLQKPYVYPQSKTVVTADMDEQGSIHINIRIVNGVPSRGLFTAEPFKEAVSELRASTNTRVDIQNGSGCTLAK